MPKWLALAPTPEAELKIYTQFTLHSMRPLVHFVRDENLLTTPHDLRDRRESGEAEGLSVSTKVSIYNHHVRHVPLAVPRLSRRPSPLPPLEPPLPLQIPRRAPWPLPIISLSD